METLEHSARNQEWKARTRRAAFSLVEVTMAIGIAAFAFVAIFGLLPVGLNTFHQSMDTSVSAQIVQRILHEIQQTDFDTLVEGHTTPFTRLPSPRYFDAQGTEVTSAASASYHLQIRITPITSVPQREIAPEVPGSNGNAHLATATVQTASNPGNLAIDIDPASFLWSDSHIPISTNSTLVSKNR